MAKQTHHKERIRSLMQTTPYTLIYYQGDDCHLPMLIVDKKLIYANLGIKKKLICESKQ